jgi:allantoinase
LERNPAVCHALKETTDWEVASHGYRWIDYRNVDEETEREHIERTIKIHEKLIGKRPVGMYQGKVNTVMILNRIRQLYRFMMKANICIISHIVFLLCNEYMKPTLNTRRLVINEGGFKYDSDSYADDIPYWTLDYGNNEKPHLIIPYTLSENDMRFTSPSNFSNGADFGQYLKDTLKYVFLSLPNCSDTIRMR